MKTKFTYIFVVLLITIFSCKEERTIIDEKSIESIIMIDRYIEDFYKRNLEFPSNQGILSQEYGEAIDTLFLNKIQKEKSIKYVPVKDVKKNKILAYYILSSNRDVNLISSNDDEDFLTRVVTACEYNKGQEGDIILSYGTAYLITSSIASFTLKEAMNTIWSEKIYYNVIFRPDSLIINDNNLYFSATKDSITIQGKFYNKLVKAKAEKYFNDGESILLQGLKTKNLETNSIQLRNVIFKRKNDSIFGNYYNEVGELAPYKHIRNCN